MNIVVRVADDADAELIAGLTRQAWSDKVSGSSSGHAETAEQVALHLRAGGCFLLVVDDAVVGSVRWLPLDSEPDVWEIARMGIVPAHRGGNLSQHLLEAVIHHGQACAVEELRLAVRADQPKLRDFYSALAFELAEELEYSHANPLEPAPYVMRRRLR